MSKEKIWGLPETTKEEVVEKIEMMSFLIRMDYSDPRGEVQQIQLLCAKLKNLIQNGYRNGIRN